MDQVRQIPTVGFPSCCLRSMPARLRSCIDAHIGMAVTCQATYDKLMSEVPKYKLITISILCDRLRVRPTHLIPPLK